MIVWHVVLSMLLAFLVLIINQLTEIKETSEGLCVVVGKSFVGKHRRLIAYYKTYNVFLAVNVIYYCPG